MSAPAVELVGPHGYTHGWIYHGEPGARAGELTPEHHAILHGRRARTPRQHRNAAHEYERLARTHTGKAREHAQRMARFHNDRARKLESGQETGPKLTRSTFNRKRAVASIREAQQHAGTYLKSRSPTVKPSLSPSTFNRGQALRGIRKAQARVGATKRNQALVAANDQEALEMVAQHESASGRRVLAAKGQALPGGGFPIPNVSYLHKAMKAIGRVKDNARRAAVARLIKKRAAQLGVTSHLKGTWVQTSPGKPINAANLTPALEFAMSRYPKYPVSSPYDVLIVRGDDGSAVVRHRRGGYEIARIRRGDDGSWVAAVDGRDGAPHTRQRGALLEAIGQHNRTSGTPYHRPVARTEPLQPPPAQTPLMAAYGIQNIRALATSTPVVGVGDGPRSTGRDGGGPTAGLGPKGTGIYNKLRKRGFPHERAHNFARRAERLSARRSGK